MVDGYIVSTRDSLDRDFDYEDDVCDAHGEAWMNKLNIPHLRGTDAEDLQDSYWEFHPIGVGFLTNEADCRRYCGYLLEDGETFCRSEIDTDLTGGCEDCSPCDESVSCWYDVPREDVHNRDKYPIAHVVWCDKYEEDE